jgi:hypothetical protein
MSPAALFRVALFVCAPLLVWPAFVAAETPEVRPVVLVPRRPPRSLSIPTIDFAELYQFGARAPEPTPKLLALQNKRVTLVGYMVELERPARGAFYLAPYPTICDESGAGRAGIPPTAVLVVPKAARGMQIAFVPGTLEVTGVLEVGNQESDGELATVRLRVDDLSKFRFARRRLTAKHR